MLKKIVALVAFSVFAFGCGPRDTRPKRVHEEQDSTYEGVGVGSADVIAMAHELKVALYAIPAIIDAESRPVVAFLPISNDTNDSLLNTSLLRQKVMMKLLTEAGDKVRIVDRDSIAAIQAEREAKRAGAVTTSGYDDILGIDFFIDGKISAMGGRTMDERGQYTMINFVIKNAETSEIVGGAEVSFKKVQPTEGIYN